MRVCLVSQEYPPDTAHGGIATQTRAKARGLADRGHDVRVLTVAKDRRFRIDHDGQVRVHRLAGVAAGLAYRTEAARWVAWSVEVAAALQAMGSSAPFDLVDFADYGAEGLTHLLDRIPGEGPAVTVHLQGPLVMLARTLGWPEAGSDLERVGTFMEGTCIRLADAVYSSSGCSADWVEREYGVARGDIPVLHVGVDTRQFAPAPQDRAARPTVVFAGRVTTTKGAVVLARAAALLVRDLPDLHVILIGKQTESSVVSELRTVADTCGRPGLFELVGEVPHDQLARQLCRGHVFAAPSRHEGGPGFVYLEAMACGIPTIGCAGSGVAEVIEHGRTGFLVPPDDPAALAAELGPLLTDQGLRDRVGAAGRRWVLEHAEAESCLSRIERFHTGVAKRSGRS